MLIPIILPAQELTVKECFGNCSLIREDSTIHITVQTNIEIGDEISIPEDSYLVLIPVMTESIEIPLFTGNYVAKDIIAISKTNDSSIILFLQNVYAYFKDDNPKKKHLVSGAVTRSDCIYALEKDDFEIINNCKKGDIRIIDTNNGSTVYTSSFSKKDKNIKVSMENLPFGLYATEIDVESNTISYLVRKEENQLIQMNLIQLKLLYNKEYMQFYADQNCIFPMELDLETELKSLSK